MTTKLALLGILLAACACGGEVVSNSGTYSLTIPEGWEARKDFDEPNVPLAVFAPKQADAKAFRENISIILYKKDAGTTLKSVAEAEDARSKKNRPDFVLSDEKEEKIGAMACVSRVCTMTFPNGVFKNRQYVVDAGDSIAVITALVPAARFKEIDDAVVKVITSFKVKK